MPAFLIVVLLLALLAVVAMLVVHSRKADANPRRRSKQRAKREDAGARDDTWPAELASASSDDAPRMPMGDLPPRPSRHRR